MRKIVSYLSLCLVMLLGVVFPQTASATQADVNEILANGGVFRIKNSGSNRYMSEDKNTNKLTGKYLMRSADSLTQVWLVQPLGNGAYTFRNLHTGRYLNTVNGSPMVTVSGQQKHYMKYSAANSGTSTSLITISWTSNFSGNTCLNENNSTRYILGWQANTPTLGDAYSDWTFEKAKWIDTTFIRNRFDAQLGAITPTNGQYVRIYNSGYGSVITESVSANTLSCFAAEATDYSQVWKVVEVSNKQWKLQNAVTDRYIQVQNGVYSTQYRTDVSVLTSFTIQDGLDPFLTDFFIKDGSGNVGLHCAATSKVVGWRNDQAASNWYFKEAVVDPAALATQRQESEALAFYQSAYSVKQAREALRNFFVDDACTELKAEFQALTDDSIKNLMSKPNTYSKVAFPTNLIDVVLKVKNNVWGAWEKSFRVHSYHAYSNNTLWNGSDYINNGYLFSPQTNPTGISVKRGRSILVFVGKDIPVGATMKVLLVNGQEVPGTTVQDAYGKDILLQRGLNYIPVANDGHVFIDYTITNKALLADFDTIPVHIQGGYVNGVFDITRGHKNADWLQMLADGLFTDEVTHLKSNYIQFNMLTKGLKEKNPISQFTEFEADGSPKALEGVLKRWDEIIEWERAVMDIEQFKPYFNSMFSASSSSTSSPYATSFGTYYVGVGNYMNYDLMKAGYAYHEGDGIWVVTHENGHLHQKAINIAGDTECSVNFFSQFCIWLQGSNVGRGPAWSNPAASFHSGQFYTNYNIWTRSRMYFQLWLYYHLQGHKPDFYPKLFALLRKDPMIVSTNASNPISGLHNYLKFAKYASEAAGEDLSEFFQFYGFFVPITNYMIDDYGKKYFTTPQADIDKTIEAMSKYPKANKSLMFIDERIQLSPANYKGMPAGQMRLATTPGVTPGVASEVGQLGMYTDFVANPTYQPYTLTATAAGVITVDATSGSGAVGFKVYDLSGKFVYAANTYSFTIPSSLAAAGYTVYAALGDGTQQQIYDSQNPTGIGSVVVEEGQKATEKVYDLSGRQTNSTAKGVYIINGKRVIR